MEKMGYNRKSSEKEKIPALIMTNQNTTSNLT